MLNNEIYEVKQYLTDLIKQEEKFFSNDVKQFYNKYKIEFIPISFSNFYKENFFLVLKFKNLGIYFNDIEEYFGICKISNDECVEYSDFSDSLAQVIRKFMNIVQNLEN